MPLLEAFAAELKGRRTKLGLSQEALALRAEVNRTYVAKLELAQNQPSLSVMFNLSTALDVDLRDFVAAVLVRYHRAKRAVGKGPKRRAPADDT